MKANKYKIVYCAPALYSAGGVERVLSVKANYFADVLGYDVTIIVTEGQGKECFFPLSLNVNVINLHIGFEELWKTSFIKKVFLYLKKQHLYRKLLSKELMRIHPDITISVLRREINFINSINDGSRKIGELHVNRANYRNFSSQDSNIAKRLFSWFWMKSLMGHLRELDRMIVLTEAAVTDWPELSNITLIPDPLPFMTDKKSCLSVKRVVSIGRYAFEKGNDLLLRAWSKVEKEHTDWCLDIYGMGDRKIYSEQMKSLGIDERRCHLHGSITDVKQVYVNSSIFVLPSRFEGFGLVIIEAMSCGLPVISFDCENGPRNIITEGKDGFLIRPFDVEKFSEKIIRLIEDDELRNIIGTNALITSRKYNIEDIAGQWKKLFDKIMR